jgi:hypothetical protein
VYWYDILSAVFMIFGSIGAAGGLVALAWKYLP